MTGPNDRPAGGELLQKNLDYTIFEWGAQRAHKAILVDRAKGVFFWDSSGKRYLDFASQAVNVTIGHADDRVVHAIQQQVGRLPYISPFLATEARGNLGELLSSLAPGSLQKSFFTLGGADANENAVRAAFAFTGRRKVASRYRSYHGGTNAMLSISGDPRRWAVEPGPPGAVRFWGPYPYRCRLCGGKGDCAQECLDHLEDVIVHEGPHTLAAVILEPIPGGYGVIVPPAGYLKGVRELCNRYGLLMIADEVMTGFGRTGEWFAVDHENVIPDIMTVSKGLTSGHVPLGACMLSQEIAEFFDDHPFPGGLTMNSYALGCAAAVATINVVIEDDLVGNSRRLGKTLLSELQRLQDRHVSIGEVRGLGLFAGIELVKDRQSKEPLGSLEAPSPYKPLVDGLKARLLADGLFTTIRGNVVLVAPPLCITEEQLVEGLAILDRALEQVDREVESV